MSIHNDNPYTEFIGLHNRREYELTVRQEPKQARMCGVGGKADRRPIDPPPIVQLRVVDPLQRSNSSSNPGGRQIARASSPNAASPSTIASSPAPSVSTVSRDGSSASDTGNVDREGDSATPTPSAAATSYAQSYLQNPYYFMFACLAKPDDDTELHWLKVNFYSLLIDIWELIFCRTVAHDVQLVPSFLPFIT
ncbi:velvet factor-domain-containing protein [Lentinula edodes]|uniref:velvet factor-domain-containing protein n=1 Tax=Lentinula edodes TaxID=5353 RepID=UPI001E8E5CD0|nr:velvet factor-domain-containing protein [Lentinula edodes]KAH7878350.1 velvet factor-domain-containing protein [Lentinula edodes]